MPAPSQTPKLALWRRYRQLPRNVFALGFVSLLNDASTEIIYPILPLFLSATLGASPAIIGIIEGTAESVSSLLKLFAGYWSDRLGRRKGLVIFGYSLAVVVRPLLAFATSWQMVFGIRLADRVGKGIRSAPRDALIADSVEPEERGLAYGLNRAMDYVGAVIGPVFSFALLYFIATNWNAPSVRDYRLLFLLASIPAFGAVVVAFFGVHEKKHNGETLVAELRPPPKFSLRGFDGNFKVFLVLVAVFTLSNSTDAFLLLRAREAGVPIAIIPLLWAALHVSKVLSALIGGHLSDHLGRKTLIASGWILYALVYAGFAFATKPWMAWALFLVYGAYFGLAEGAEKALVADLVRADQRGTAFGLYNLAFSITVLPASLLMGWVWLKWGAQTAFLLSAGLGIVAAVTLLLTVNAPRVLN
ncbi:MAG: MFS transporter, partial [Pyrinomonadaceae bacterium]